MSNASAPTLVCVKGVKQEWLEEWDESMPLPGDIIMGIAETDTEELFVPAKAKAELSSQLGKIVSQHVEFIWVKVRRGANTIKLRVRIVQYKYTMLQRKYTIKAATDDRHVAILGDMTIEQCAQLQEMSRRVVNVERRGFNRRGVKYEWKIKMDTYLPDQGCSVVSSILFMPFPDEHCVEATTTRCMAWFSASVSSGVPLVFVNIQTEQIATSEKQNLKGSRETSWGRQQNDTTTIQIVQGIRLWFLPGVAEVLVELMPTPGEVRYGMDIKRTEEGFICINSVTKGSAADRAGLGRLHEEAYGSGHLLVISRLEGKSLMPSNACSAGFIHCCDHSEIRDLLSLAIDQTDRVLIHVMTWSKQTRPNALQPVGAVASLRPPDGSHSGPLSQI
ncbi:hypothetical protein FNV43_RR11270 [Rhamnella rubrinervis]|uniref:Uncharacterized protein n=1 Tax=Rhamnella rubrinervis TaxID=2594499 RepID=A0A8K0MHG8_9ROSA|nr:hypothetical protein FNV43_RR11270 [Rhamnella rubrinervis]